MPTYDYKCKNCKKSYSTSVQTSYSKLKEILAGPCPSCEEKELFQDLSEVSTNFSMKSRATSSRREVQWGKKKEKLIHEEKVSNDAYYDMRND